MANKKQLLTIRDVINALLEEKRAMSPSSNRGVHVELQNGWTVSIQCGAGNYCDWYHDPIVDIGGLHKSPDYWFSSSTAEVAAWKDERWYSPDGDGEPWVGDYFTADETMDFVRMIEDIENVRSLATG